MARKDPHELARWPEAARHSHYVPRLFARKLNVSLRQLERDTRELFHCTLGHWLNDQRMSLAPGLLIQLGSVKLVAGELDFKHASHFSREFSRFHNISPRAFMKQSRQKLAITAEKLAETPGQPVNEARMSPK